MSNIKSTITLNSTTLFPSPIKVTISTTEQVNGLAQIQTFTLNPSENLTIFGPTTEPDPSNTVYLYAQSLNTNRSDLTIYVQDQNGTEIILGLLHPSDFIWLPLAVYGSNVKVTCANLDVANSAKLNVFWGHRS